MSDPAYAEETIQSYLDRLASGDPEPGGGSAAALVAALGAALLSMVANLTLGKEKYVAVQTDVSALKESAERLRRELTGLITLDAMAYRKVAEAMKLPQATDEEKERRKTALQEALQGAAGVPMQIAAAAVDVARLAIPAAEKGNVNAVSDSGVAVLLADAAAQAAALNVRINLAWIDDDDFKRQSWAEIEALLSEAARLRDVALAMTYSAIG